MRWPGFCGASMRSDSLLANPEQTMNWYPQTVRSSGGESRVVLYPTPGLRTFTSAPQSPGRGIFAENARAFAVIGNTLYEVFADGSTTSLGTVAIDQYPATLVTNGDGGGELFVVSGTTGYIYNLSTGAFASQVSNVTMGGMIDGFFVALDTATSTFKISDLLDGTTWDSTQVLQRSTAPDPWKALLVRYPRIWLLGEKTGDILYNAGTSPFPFAPVPSVQIPYGIAAPFTLKVAGNAVMWLTQNSNGVGQVVEAVGYNPQVVSTEAVEYAIRQYDRIDDAVAYSYQAEGHEFYVLNFPSGNRTWVYDRTEAQWHERGSFDGTTGEYDIWGPQYHTHAFGTHLVLHAENGSIYEMSPDVYTDADGAVLRRMRRPPALHDENRWIYLDRLRLFLDTGIGLVSGQGSDPTIMLRLSRDGGVTWGAERGRSAGVGGDYTAQVEWLRCGRARTLALEVSVSDPVPWRLVDLYADLRRGTNPYAASVPGPGAASAA